MMNRLAYPLCALLVALFTLPAHADLMISFTEDGTPFEVTINVGEDVVVPIYIRQTAPDDVLTETGLAAAGAQVNFGVTGKNASISNAVLDPIWENTANFFKLGFSNQDGVVAMFGLHQSYADLSGEPQPVKGNPIRVGTVTFVGNTANDVTTFWSSDVDWDGLGVTVTNVVLDANNNSLDAQVFAVSTLGTITTVPEPSSLLMALLALCLSTAVYRSRRNA